MIACPSCGNESADDAMFCGFCGTKLRGEQRKTLFKFKAVQKKDVEDEKASSATETESSENPDSAPGPASPDRSEPMETLQNTTAAQLAAAVDSPDVEGVLDSGWSVDVDDIEGEELSARDTLEEVDDETAAKVRARVAKEIEKQRAERAEEERAARQQEEEPLFSAADVVEKSAEASTAQAEAGASDAGGSMEGATVPEAPAVEREAIDAGAPTEQLEPIDPMADDEGPSAGEAVLRSGTNLKQPDMPKVVAEGGREVPPKKRKPRVRDDGRRTRVMPNKGTRDVPAPGASSKSAAPASSKEDEKSFFGTSLSKYDMKAVDKSYLEGDSLDKDVEQEFQKAKSRSLGLMLVALLVIGLIVGAIVFLLMTTSQ